MGYDTYRQWLLATRDSKQHGPLYSLRVLMGRLNMGELEDTDSTPMWTNGDTDIHVRMETKHREHNLRRAWRAQWWHFFKTTPNPGPRGTPASTTSLCAARPSTRRTKL